MESGKYLELTGKIIGCAIEVHRVLGSGYQEVIYQRALYYEMFLQGLQCVREFEMEIHYKNQHIGSRRVDFLVEGVLSVETKALRLLEPIHLAQAINYLEVSNLEVGLLFNFGAARLETKRVVNAKYSAIQATMKKRNI